MSGLGVERGVQRRERTEGAVARTSELLDLWVFLVQRVALKVKVSQIASPCFQRDYGAHSGTRTASFTALPMGE